MIEGLLNLSGLLAGLASLYLAGNGLFVMLSPEPRAFSFLENLAISFGLGALAITLWMLALSSLGLPFGVPLIFYPWFALAVLALLFNHYVRPRRRPFPHLIEKRQPPARLPFSAWDRLFLTLLAVLFVYAVFRAALYPVWAWDAYATWAFKAKVFYLNQTVNLQGFEAHNYYPNLVPLLLTYLYLWLMQVNDHLVKLVFPLFGAALLALLYSFFLRMGLSRTRSLGLTAFFALNGVTFIVHLYITYADLALTYFTLGAVGLIYLWLTDRPPRDALPLSAAMCAGMAWCKFEGSPLAATIVLAAGLTLLWLRPPNLGRRLLDLIWPIAGILLGYLPWRLFMQMHHIETGSDHILGFYAGQLWQALPALLQGLFYPKFFGLLWLAALLSLVWLLKKPRPSDIPGRDEACLAPTKRQGLFRTRPLLATPALFLALFLGGNLLAILLGYALAPTSAEEFPFYIRATLDRLLLHIAPVAALLIGEGLKDVGGGEKM
jgi:hypothetical protein